MNYYPLAVKKHFTEQKNLYLLLLKILISLGLITFIIIKVNFNQVVEAVRNARLIYLIPGFSLVLLNVYLQFLKWEITAKQLLNVGDRKKIFYSLFYGLSGGAFTPARLGEYGGRGIVLKEKSFLEVSIATFIEKLFIMVIEIFFGLIAALIFLYFKSFGSNYLLVNILILALLLVFAGLVIYFRKNRREKLIKLVNKIPYFKRKQGVVNQVLSLNKKYFVSMLVYTTLFYFCYVSQFALFAHSFSHGINFINCLWAGALVMFSKSILGYFSFSELGIREGAAVYFLSAFGQPGAVGFNTAIFIFITNIILPASFGLLLMLKRNNDK